ncbi:MAG: pimelyl-ACP methyl ester esterase BioV [Epsilonproteobacteria bacterium]|nr:pimelyl-ACP methyl ester esterase BioV [Campylobacterota bacterium]
MNFFSGFSLHNEADLFATYHDSSEYCVSGFSLGAIEAFEYLSNTKKRLDKLQLFSPAFFQNKRDKFKRLQTISYQKDQKNYEETFLKNIAYPSDIDMHCYFKKDDLRALEKLLNFVWKPEALETLIKRGVEIEVYLGSEDKIIDVEAAYDFFKPYATLYLLKQRGHILHG